MVVTSTRAPERAAARPGGLRALARELRSWPTILMVVLCLVVGLPLTIALTPSQDLTILGQHIAVGARTPDATLEGPAGLVQIGNTHLDVPLLQVWGPMRPQLVLGPVQRNADAARVFDPNQTAEATSQAVEQLKTGFVNWYVLGALGVVGAALAIAALVGCARMLGILRRSRSSDLTVADVWHRCSGAIGRMALVAVTVSVAAWGVCGALAYTGTTRGLAQVHSLSDLVGATRVTPSPVGPTVTGFAGAVIGDSRAARVGGPPVPNPEGDDVVCERSADSLAAELATMVPGGVRNLACPSATIASGLRGPQQRGSTSVPPQVGLLKQMPDLEYVVVAIGPNDVGWSDLVKYCYGVSTCDDNLTRGEFDYRMASFDRDYAGLLQDLAELPSHPQVIVVTSYGAFPKATDPACPDARGPDFAVGLTQDKIDLLTNRNDQLNAVLRAGAEKYRFTVADPSLRLLCSPGVDGMGPDLQGLTTAYAFHPTALGSLRLAATVARLVRD
jgi:hypothetical protein